MTNSEISPISALKNSVVAFRLGMEGQASRNLIELIDFLAPVIQEPDFPSREEMNRLLGELLSAQSRKDYLRAADLLEYEIARWITVGETCAPDIVTKDIPLNISPLS